MKPVQVTITHDSPAEGKIIEHTTLDIVTALAVMDINVGSGTAEISDGDVLLARLRKRGKDGATYWEVG